MCIRDSTACDLRCTSLAVSQPDGFSIPAEEELEESLKNALSNCQEEGLFAEPPIIDIVWEKKTKKQEKSDEKGETKIG